MNDPVLTGMANDLRDALLEHGLDPTNPPEETRPPASKAFAEYRRRGGSQFTNARVFIVALVLEVKQTEQ